MNDTVPLLGKRPPKRYYAEVAAKFEDFIDAAELAAGLPDTPDTWGWARYMTAADIPMYLNDELPDCTCATVGHMELTQSRRAGDAEIPTDDAVRELFHRTGIEQGLSDDDGRYAEGVLASWKRTGFRQSTGDPNSPEGSLETILGYAAVNFADHEQVRAAGYIFGGLVACIALPMTALYQENTGRNWSCNTVEGYSSAPGSWGGHMVYMSGLNLTGPVFFTWGHKRQTTWCFWDKYVDECYAVATEDWASRDDVSPNGFHKQALIDLLATL
jgi:hypothetical protein